MIRSPMITVIAFGLLAGSAIGVTAQDSVAEPVEFTAQWAWGPEVRVQSSSTVDGALETRDGAWRMAY